MRGGPECLPLTDGAATIPLEWCEVAKWAAVVTYFEAMESMLVELC